MPRANIVRSDDLRYENRRRLLHALRSDGPSSPASLARETGLSAASISALSSQLAEEGVVKSARAENQGASTRRGRPQTLIGLHGGAGDIITLNLAIDLIRVRRVDYEGTILNTETIVLNTRETDEKAIMGFITKSIQKVIEQQPDRMLRCIGVGFQGITENLSGTLIWSPIIQPQHVQLGDILKDRFQLPVSVNNDCVLISEALNHGYHESLGNSFATVLFSHGVGLGLFLDGQPFSGVNTSALEMGHLRYKRDGALCRCGKRGCIEAYAADYGIVRLALGESIHDEPFGRVEPAQIDELRESAENNNEAASQAFVIAGAAIGEGLSTLFTLFDPLPVALVGRSQSDINLMREGIDSVLDDQRGDAIATDSLLHCFDDAEPLLDSGLTHNTLEKADRIIAYSLQNT